MSQSSFRYTFRPGENIREEFLRLLALLSAQTSRLVPCPPQVLPESIHYARTLIKRTRSFLWFGRSVLGPVASIRLRRRLRNAAQFLAASRDRTAIQSTLKKLAQDTSSSRDREALALFAVILMEKPTKFGASVKSLHDPLLKAVQFLLRALEEMSQIAVASTLPWPDPSERLAKAFRVVRKVGKKAQHMGTDFQFHEWRKKAKRLLHQLELIHDPSDKRSLRTIKHVDRLQEKLGDYHDCVVVQDRLRKLFKMYPQTTRLIALLEKRKKHLGKKAQKLRTLFK